MGFMDKAKDFADQHDEQVDKGLDKAGDPRIARIAGILKERARP